MTERDNTQILQRGAHNQNQGTGMDGWAGAGKVAPPQKPRPQQKSEGNTEQKTKL
jgi:hypothetical protein